MLIRLLGMLFVSLSWAATLEETKALEQSLQLSVQDAYKRIPHKRTAFDISKAKMHTAEKNVLVSAFYLVDQLTVLRVKGQELIAAGNKITHLNNIYLEKISELKQLAATAKSYPKLQLSLGLIADAASQQFQFLRYKSDSLGGFRMPASAQDLVGAASEKLKRAYSILVEQYPKEATQNKSAFYDYLCALDFV